MTEEPTNVLGSDVSSRLDASLISRGAQPSEDQLVLAPYIRASSIGRCGRQIVLASRMTLPNTYTPESALALIQGDWGEEGMARLLASSGYTIRDKQRELRHYDGDREIVRGHIDGILDIEFGSLGVESALWENKMMSAFRFKKLHALGLEESCPEYWAQIHLYMTLLNLDGEHIKQCVFTTVAKDPSAMNMGVSGPRIHPIRVDIVEHDREFGDELLSRADGLLTAVESGSSWPYERTSGIDWDCSKKFCPVYDVCQPPHVEPERKKRNGRRTGTKA